MAALVTVTTILDDDTAAGVLAFKAVDQRFAARALISPPLESVRRGADGSVQTLTEFRVDLECTQDQVIALRHLIIDECGMDAPSYVTPILDASKSYAGWIRRATR